MGGCGSGVRLGATPKHQVEWCLVLDVGLLAGRPITHGDEGPVALRAASCAWHVEASYRVQNAGRCELSVWLPLKSTWVRSDIELVTVRLASGGKRPLMLCPGLPGGPACGGRVAKLYWPLFGRGAFGCRDCHRLAYQSSQARSMTWKALYRPTEITPLRAGRRVVSADLRRLGRPGLPSPAAYHPHRRPPTNQPRRRSADMILEARERDALLMRTPPSTASSRPIRLPVRDSMNRR